MNNRRTFFIALTFLGTIVACVVPGLQTAPAPAPTADTSSILSTMVAETVSAAITLTEQAVPAPALVPTSTPEGGASGSTLTPQGDGSTLFVDVRTGYEASVPIGWVAAGVNKQEFLDAFTLTADMQNFLLSVQTRDPNTFRMFAIDMQPEHFQNGFFTNMNFIWDGQNAGLITNNDGLKAGIAQVAGATPEPAIEILSTTLITTSNGIPMAIFESKNTVKNSSNEDLFVFQKQAIFNVGAGTVAVTVSTVEGLKDAIFYTFDAMLETIKLTPK